MIVKMVILVSDDIPEYPAPPELDGVATIELGEIGEVHPIAPSPSRASRAVMAERSGMRTPPSARSDRRTNRMPFHSSPRGSGNFASQRSFPRRATQSALVPQRATLWRAVEASAVRHARSARTGVKVVAAGVVDGRD